MNQWEIQTSTHVFTMTHIIYSNKQLKQQEMADNLNISLPNLSNIENGTSYPSYDFFYNMVAHYNVNLNYLLFGGREEMFRAPGKEVPSKDTDTDEDPIEKELRLIRSRDDFREFFQSFFGSRVIQYHIMSEFFDFIETPIRQIGLILPPFPAIIFLEMQV